MTERDPRTRLSRRAVLAAGLGAGVTALAGCSTGGGDTEPPLTPSATPLPARDADIRSVTFEGREMVVRLVDDHAVSKLTLIAPDGSAFAQAEVVTGATTVRIPVLDIESGLAGYEHYTPGRYELVAVRSDESHSVALELRPDLRIVDIRQFERGKRAGDYGNLAVVIENVGTAPTWVYDIVYRNAPHDTANDELVDGAGIPQLVQPTEPDEQILSPGERQSYVGLVPPFVFPKYRPQRCNGQVETQVVVGVATGGTLETRIRASIGGETNPIGTRGEHVCTELSIEVLDEPVVPATREGRSFS